MLENFKLVLNLLPLLVQLIKAAEQAIPEPGQGAAKLALVREILETLDAGLLGAWPLIEKIIKALVKAFNATGMFP